MSSQTSTSSTDTTAYSPSVDWHIQMTNIANDTINPIRLVVSQIRMPENPPKEVISLSIGDPTVFGNLNPPQSVLDAFAKAVTDGKANGYAPSVGFPSARQAIAEYMNHEDAPVTMDDVIITSGCSGAIVIAIQGVADRGDNILVPKPGFSLYHTASKQGGVEAREYALDPSAGWQVDLKHLESLIDDKTKAILVNNPSNPTGSNYSKEHLLDIIAVAEKHKLPIIADEIYAGMVFSGETFYAMAPLTSEVPVIACGGIAKKFLVPGWRLGWITVHDRNQRLQHARSGMGRLSMLILGANVPCQAALPDILKTPDSHLENVMKQLETQAKFLCDRIDPIEGLNIIKPQGAMYVMVQLPPELCGGDDRKFTQALLDEEQVFVLPGACFNAPGFFRIVTCPPLEKLQEACDRIEAFVGRHLQK